MTDEHIEEMVGICFLNKVCEVAFSRVLERFQRAFSAHPNLRGFEILLRLIWQDK